MPRAISQTKEDKYHMFHLHGESKKQMGRRNKTEIVSWTEQTCGCHRGGRQEGRVRVDR